MIEKERRIIFKKRRKTNRESIGGINEPILLAKDFCFVFHCFGV
jgi:hypothetical protein